MNKPDIATIEGNFEASALDVLRGVPGLTVVAHTWSTEPAPDVVLRYAGHEQALAIDVRLRANAATAWQLVHYAQHSDTPVLLVAGETTSDAREILVDHGIAFVDGLANAHIALPGLMFHVEGSKRQRGRAAATVPPTRLRGKAGLAVQALLRRPDREWSVRDVSEEAGIAIGTAHRVLTRLEKEGLVETMGAGPQRVRSVANPTALLDLWAEEQVSPPRRTRGFLLAQSPRQLVENLGANLDHTGIDYAFTGAAGASFLAPFITAIPVTELWVSAAAAPEELFQGAETNPAIEGENVVFLQGKDDAPLAFRERVGGIWIANPFRLYADLRRDPRRGQEQADHLRQEVIGF